MVCVMVREWKEKRNFLDFVWKCLVFSQIFRARYLIGDYLGCIRRSVLYGVITAFMLYSETY